MKKNEIRRKNTPSINNRINIIQCKKKFGEKMVMKTIKVTEEVHTMLSELGSKKDTYNEIILKLIQEHNENLSEELDDDQASYYNKCIEKIENDDYSDIIEVDFDNIDEELKRLENEGSI